MPPVCTLSPVPRHGWYYRWQWVVRILGEAVCLVNTIIRATHPTVTSPAET